MNPKITGASAGKLNCQFSRAGQFVRHGFGAALVCWLLVGCAHPRPAGAQLTRSEVIRIAEQAAERDGLRMSQYKRKEVRYHGDRKLWFVFFEERGCFLAFGSHFAVFVDDQTGKPRIVGGM